MFSEGGYLCALPSISSPPAAEEAIATKLLMILNLPWVDPLVTTSTVYRFAGLSDRFCQVK